MPNPAPHHAPWTPAERKILAKLSRPIEIQGFLNTVAYSADKFARSPRSVMRDRKANCYDGALFAAAALRQLGYPPLLLDMRPEPGRDDDHVIAIFRRQGGWGSIAKSNFVGLRYREPIHRSLRELVISYFNDYFNDLGTYAEKTLRSYSVPVNLAKLDRLEWETRDDNLDEVAGYLDRARHIPIVTRKQAAELELVDERTLKAGLFGSVKAGLFKVG
ncbi:MAG TPA: hypothetical protein VGK67_29610 [Myxococcales bacterium]|jgi:hypothetical protein